MIKTVMYIIVDDDLLNNMICKILLKATLGEVEVRTFSDPAQGLLFIQNEFGETSKNAILLLDINMPTFTGWEFLEEYEKFSIAIKDRINIYMLSSSVGQNDKLKAKKNKDVKSFISKPLDREDILLFADGV